MFSVDIFIVRAICNLATRLGCCPFEFLPKEKKLAWLKPKNQRQGQVKAYIIYALTACYVIQYLWDYFVTQISMIAWLISTVYLLMLIGFAMLSFESYRHASDTILYINGMIQFEKMYGLGAPSEEGFWGNLKRQPLLNQLNLGLATSFYCMIYGIPVVTHGVDYFRPCETSRLGYWMLPDCHSGWNPGSATATVGNYALKTIVFFVNQWMWMYLCCIGAFVVGVMETVSFLNLKENVMTFWKHYEGDNVSMESLVQMYRQIQVLARCGNGICQEGITIGSIIAVILIHAISICILIQATIVTDSESRMMMIFLGIFCLLNTAGGMHVSFMGMATVCLESRKVRENMKLKQVEILGKSRLEYKCRMRYIRSFHLIMVRFGGFNFFDNNTSLHCMDMSNSWCINILLLK